MTTSSTKHLFARIQIKKQNSEVKVMYMLRVLKACYPVGGERNGCFARSKSVLHE